MYWPIRGAIFLSCAVALPRVCPAQEWTEASVVAQFLEQSPYAREARARSGVAEAEARGRTRFLNPLLQYSREGAGRTEFYQAEQTLPLSGRRPLLRQAGASGVRAVEAAGAFDLWQARSALRLAFYQVLSAQERESVYATAAKEIDRVLLVLRSREREGEGTKFDRMRTERERAELLAESALARAETEMAMGRMLAFLPVGTVAARVTGTMNSGPLVADAAALTQRALLAREDMKAEQGRLEQFRWEQRAAEKLRIPEPLLSAGMKRADVGARNLEMGPVVSVSIPLPLFNKGQDEVARFSAERERTAARVEILTRQIRAAVEGTARAFTVRRQARDSYERELADSGPELIRMASVAYQEGEIGILQLLDAYRLERQARLRMLEIQLSVKEAQIELERVLGEELGQ
jgi:cobalt-zinc-cadmium efflux system outer membrane protein